MGVLHWCHHSSRRLPRLRRRVLSCWFVTQINVNNRNVKVTDIYDETMISKTERTVNEYGTMETACGVGPHNMNAQKITIMFYEVTATNSLDDVSDPGRIISTLSSIGATM